jgi:hypothetical protein
MNNPLSKDSPLDLSSRSNSSSEDSFIASKFADEVTDRPSRNANEPIDLALQPKPSRAVILWMLLIAIVLAVLGYEMHGDKHPPLNVAINMTGDASDCEAIVDEKSRGGFLSSERNNNHMLWLNLDNGKHHIDIQKAGKTFQSRDFEVNGKVYLRFDSGSTSESN